MANSKNLKRGPGPGRPKGSPNKFTHLKSAFSEAFEAIGGTDGLVAWAKKPKNRGTFYAMIVKMLPREKEDRTDPDSTYRIGEALKAAQERQRKHRLWRMKNTTTCPTCQEEKPPKKKKADSNGN